MCCYIHHALSCYLLNDCKLSPTTYWTRKRYRYGGNDSNLLIVFYVQIMPDDFVMQLHRF
ncbi:hypothetical protein CBL17_02850 [Shigella sonnei]|uniref:Uncharacterized protein n=1 Tax=Shigella sonnei TaxID=624 RepID=A0AAU8VYN4_SHISO|nr:hypothetical protein B9127_15640 [Shigella sonnei]ARS05503.1 hypothetical protein BZ172_08905 [Shigella sonnei]ASN35493.1 hypothetical protein B9129_15080 [Shigella sonnei]OUZ67125.1 hypothetical protein CBL19_10135 [Shigella sonnei]OUZ95418.1 hypothetical protein CBL17_02850 [Shigella sonnei]